MQHRRAHAVALGIGVALGHIDPGLAFYRAVADTDARALVMKRQADAARLARR